MIARAQNSKSNSDTLRLIVLSKLEFWKIFDSFDTASIINTTPPADQTEAVICRLADPSSLFRGKLCPYESM